MKQLSSSTKLTVILVPVSFCLILIVALPVTFQTSSVVISNDMLLQPAWVIGYCTPNQQPAQYCIPRLSFENNLVTITANSNVSTFLFEFPLDYDTMLSHSKLTFDLTLAAQNVSNFTAHFSQVVNGVYYSAYLMNVTSQRAYTAIGQVLDQSAVKDSLSLILDQPVRLQIDVHEPSSRLMIGFELDAQDLVLVSAYLSSNNLWAATIVSSLGICYGLIPTNRSTRKIAIPYLIAGCGFGGYSLARDIFPTWPTLSTALTWIFVLGSLAGAILLLTYVWFDVQWD